VQQAQQELKAFKVRLVQLALQVIKVYKVSPARRVHKDQPAHQSPAQPVRKVRQASPVRLALSVQQVLLVRQALPAYKVSKV